MEKRELEYFCLILAGGLILYYLMPLFFNTVLLHFGLLLVLYPVYAFITGMIYTAKFGVQIKLPFLAGALFVPASLLYLGWSYVVYALLYLAMSLLGGCIGYPIYRRYRKR